MLPPEPSWRPTTAEYHSDRSHWSPSMLKTFRDSPERARALYVGTEPLEADDDEAGGEPDSEAGPAKKWLTNGSLVDLMLLTPELEATGVHVVQVASRSTKAFKQAQLDLGGGGCMVVTRPEYENARRAVGALHARSTPASLAARKLLAPIEPYGYSQWAGSGQHRGVPVKCMVDRLLDADIITDLPPGKFDLVLADLKTAKDPSPSEFARSAIKFGYPEQAAFNRALVAAACGTTPARVDVRLLVQRSSPPYEWAVYRLPPSWLDDAWRQVDRELEVIGKCLAGELPWCATWEAEELQELVQPAWAKSPAAKKRSASRGVTSLYEE